MIGGLDVRVNRNYFGRQIESFETNLDLPFLAAGDEPSRPFPGVFIRAPVVEKILVHVDGAQNLEAKVPDSVIAPSKQAEDEVAKAATSSKVSIMAVLPRRTSRFAEMGIEIERKDVGDIVAVQQGNVFGTSFHPELTSDARIHVWWLHQVITKVSQRRQLFS